MTGAIITHLESLFHSGQLTGFLCSRLPPDNLVTGWIDQGLLHQMLPHGISDRKAHELFLIPGDRFARLAMERGIRTNGFALFLLGQQGLKQRKLVIYIGPIETDNESPAALVLWTRKMSPLDLAIIIESHLIARSQADTRIEPCLDYIEQLRSGARDGMVSAAVSFYLQTEVHRIDDVLRRVEQSASESESVPLRFGTSEDVVPLAKVFLKWLFHLDTAKKIKDVVAAAIFSQEGRVELAMWDSPRSLATFATFDNISPSSIAWYYLLSLWSSAKDDMTKIFKQHVETPRVQTVFSSSEVTVAETNLNTLLSRLKKIEPETLSARIQTLESRIKQLEQQHTTRNEPDHTSVIPNEFAVLSRRLHDVVTHLEAIAERLIAVEKQIRSIRHEKKK